MVAPLALPVKVFAASAPLGCTEQRAAVDTPLFVRAPAANAPLVVFVHGGAWRRGDKTQIAPLAPAFTSHGFAFASVNYRLFPQAGVAAQAQDVCAAVQSLRGDARQLGFDPTRVILMGHSAGASLAALVAPQLKLRGLVLLDPVGVDAVKEVQQTPGLAEILGQAPAQQLAVSPVAELASGLTFPPTFIAYTDFRPDTVGQSQSMAAALSHRGELSGAKFYPGLRHGTFFMNLARPTQTATDVFAFLQQVSR